MLSHILGEIDAALKSLLHVVGQVSELTDPAGPDTLRLVVALVLREPECNESENNDLGNVRLCRGH